VVLIDEKIDPSKPAELNLMMPSFIKQKGYQLTVNVFYGEQL
jgi:hypothetical protein